MPKGRPTRRGSGSSTGPAVSVEGADELARSLAKAADELDDLGPLNREAAQRAAAEVRKRAPRRSGALAGSVRVGEITDAIGLVEVGAGIAYAGVIQYGWPARHIKPQPFVTDGAHKSEVSWIGLYTDHLARVINRIHT